MQFAINNLAHDHRSDGESDIFFQTYFQDAEYASDTISKSLDLTVNEKIGIWLK